MTAPGSIIEARTRPNSNRRSGNRKYAKPKATSELDSVMNTAASTAISNELPTQASSGSFSHTST